MKSNINDYNSILKETENAIFKTTIGKYCSSNEKSWNDLVERFKNKLKIDSEKGLISKETAEKIPSLLSEKKFIPGGSILYSFGNTEKKSSFSNCYYIDIPTDSLEGIFSTLQRNARTFSYRGGVGNSLEILRPNGANVNNSANESTGSVSFMPLFANTTSTVAQKGRRGALMLSHAIWHPDIEDFILSKTETKKVFGKDMDLKSCNISVKLTNDFMEAVEKDENWKLVFPDIESDKEKYNKEWNGDLEDWKLKGGKIKEYKKIKARKLLKMIAEASWKSGDPGVLFWDNIKNNTPTSFNPKTAPRGVNPCLSGDTTVLIGYKNEENNIEIKECNIKDVKEGDLILSYSIHLKRIGLDKVIFAGKTKENQEVIRINQSLKLTLDHKVYVYNRFGVLEQKEAKDIIVGDNFLDPSNHKTVCKTIEKLQEKEDVYDITTELYHNFFANGILVHNCGEQILSNYGNCLLGASVIYKYVNNPYEHNASFDFESYFNDIPYIFEFMDYLIDINNHPLDEQKKADTYSRKIGYELTGIADALSMLGFTYDSGKSLEFLELFLKGKLIKEFETEIELAKRKGKSPSLEGKIDEYINQPFIKKIFALLNGKGNDFISNIKKYGVRNIAWSTYGPTGSLSIIANNCTSGIEPLFSFSYKRKMQLFNEEFNMLHYPLFSYLIKNKPEEIELSTNVLKEKYNYKEAYEIKYEDRIKFQSLIQEYTTDSISSTINLPEEITPDEIYKIYLLSWKYNLKGITIFRKGCQIDGILSNSEDEKEQKSNILIKKDIPQEADSKRYVVRGKNGEKIYVNVVKDKNNFPLEVFAKLGNDNVNDKDYSNENFLDKLSSWDSVARLVSLSLRFGIPLSEIVEQLDKSSFYSFSLSKIISDILKKYQNIKGFQKCPVCGEYTLKIENGCETCISCGFSKCSL